MFSLNISVFSQNINYESGRSSPIQSQKKSNTSTISVISFTENLLERLKSIFSRLTQGIAHESGSSSPIQSQKKSDILNITDISLDPLDSEDDESFTIHDKGDEPCTTSESLDLLDSEDDEPCIISESLKKDESNGLNSEAKFFVGTVVKVAAIAFSLHVVSRCFYDNLQ